MNVYLEKASNFISYLFHPIFYFFYLNVAFWLFFPYQNHQVATKGVLLILALILFNTALLPIIIIWGSKKSILTGTLSERRYALLATTIVYTAMYLLLASKILIKPLEHILLATIIGLCFAYIINLFFKASLHASGAGGLVAIMLYYTVEWGSIYIYALMLVLLIAGLVGSARLYLKAHTPTELAAGYASGFVVSYAVLYFVN